MSRSVTRAVAAAALAAMMAGAGTVVAVPASPVAPAPAELVRATGSWISHGYSLDLRADGTGEFAAWVGAFDGTTMRLRLVPYRGPAAVAEVVAIETAGAGGLAPDEVPGAGGLLTIAFGDRVRTAHVEWTSGPRRMAADLCPAEGLDADQMAVLRFGA